MSSKFFRIVQIWKPFMKFLSYGSHKIWKNFPWANFSLRILQIVFPLLTLYTSGQHEDMLILIQSEALCPVSTSGELAEWRVEEVEAAITVPEWLTITWLHGSAATHRTQTECIPNKSYPKEDPQIAHDYSSTNTGVVGQTGSQSARRQWSDYNWNIFCKFYKKYGHVNTLGPLWEPWEDLWKCRALRLVVSLNEYTGCHPLIDW